MQTHFLGQAADGAMELGGICNDIVGGAGPHGSEGHHSPFDRVDIAADNGLDLGDKIGCGD